MPLPPQRIPLTAEYADPVLEITRFRLAVGADAQSFGVADDALQQRWYYQHPGCRRRTTASSEDGYWVSLVWWTDGSPVPTATDHSLLTAGYTDDLVDPGSLRIETYSG